VFRRGVNHHRVESSQAPSAPVRSGSRPVLIGAVLSLLAVTVIIVSITTMAGDSNRPQEDILDCEERA
jgi:hypothetical protein